MRRLGFAVRSALVLVLLIVAAACGASADPYRALHQERSQEVPGSLDLSLLPVGEFAPQTSPDRAYRSALRGDDAPDVAVTLARIHDAASGRTSAPAWVFVTRNLCLFTSKGDLVSDARTGDGDNCTRKNIFFQAVDASSGRLLSSFAGYDPDARWRPARVGGPDQLAAATSFH